MHKSTVNRLFRLLDEMKTAIESDQAEAVRAAAVAEKLAQEAKKNSPRGTRGKSSLDLQIAKRIRLAREESGHTQTTIARALGLSHQQLQKYETGANRMSIARLLQFCRFLGLKVEDVLPQI